MDEQFLYSVEYHDWNSDLSGFIDRQVLAVGINEEDAIENARQRARTDSRDFKATKIDTVMGMEISVTQPEERAHEADVGETRPAAVSGERLRAPIQAYIENAHDESIGGFTIPLPTTKEALQPWLDAVEAGGFDESHIAIRDARSSMPGLEETLRGFLEDGAAFDELNYLATKISGMKDWQAEIFAAALETEYCSGSVKELINLAENINLFDLQPAFNVEQYGEFQIQMGKDNTANVFERLEQSEDPEERELAQYILQLEAYADEAAFGRGVAREEGGAFTERGYLALRGEMKDVYRGLEDIPPEQRIFSAPPPPMMVTNVEVPDFLARLHAAAGDFSRDAEHNIGVLTQLRSAEYLLLMSNGGAYLSEAMHVYRRGTTGFDLWMNAAETPGTQAFAIHLTEVHGQIAGNVAQVDVTARQLDILHHSIQYTRVDAVSKTGEQQSFAPKEWEAMSAIDRDKIESWTRHFDGDDLQSVLAHLGDLCARDESACRVAPASDFLCGVNTVYMAQARHPQPDMLRVSQTAAQEMLARSDGEVYRLLPEGPEKLSPTDAVKSGLWFSEHREFAIRREDAAGFQKWAERSAAAVMNRPQERGEQKKAHEPEV